MKVNGHTGTILTILQIITIVIAAAFFAAKISESNIALAERLDSIAATQQYQQTQLQSISTTQSIHEGWTKARNEQIDGEFAELRDRMARLEENQIELQKSIAKIQRLR
jgi:hypothetical protein